MISIKEALSIVLSQNWSKKIKNIKVVDSQGFNLSKEVNATLNLPAFDNSAMDGYAVCGYTETYTIKGEVAAGSASAFDLKEGDAVRIFTGGRVPDNATAVIMQEKTEVRDKLLNVRDEVVKGKNIRRRGEELKEGETVFETGQHINPATIGVLSSLGLEEVGVFEKPSVSILTTGNELIKPGQPLKEGIYESNGPTLSAAIKQFGFDCALQVQIKDDFDAIKWAIGERLEQTDVLLVSGGISVGDYDYVKQALEENGVEELFYKVAQKPGKPLYFGRKGDSFVFALPGNPASALTCFYMYVLPLLQHLSGASKPGLQRLRLPMAHEYIMKSDRPTFFKAEYESGQVRLMQGQSSSMLHALALGTALVFIDRKGLFEEGDLVDCYLLQ